MELTSKVKRTSFSVLSRMDFPRATPALKTRTVGLPTVRRISAATEATVAELVMSHLK